MKDKLKGMIIGLVVGMCIAASSVMALSGTVTKSVTYRDIRVTLDGERVQLYDVNGDRVEPFIIDGTTYLPVRAVAEALDLEVDWDNRTSTVELTSSDDYYGDSHKPIIDYYDILSGDEDVVDFDSGKQVTLEELPDINNNYSGSPSEYCVIDLDDDGEDEIVVEFGRKSYIAVLHEERGEWVAYSVAPENMEELKADGTATWTENEDCMGTCRYVFNSYGMEIMTIIHIDDASSDYNIYGIKVSRKNCTMELEVHEDKENAKFEDIDDLY